MSDLETPIRKDDEDRAIVLFLSLYLLLLAFFIVLNSISTLEQEKAEAAMISVADVFGWRSRTGTEMEPPAVTEGKFLEPEEFHEKIADLVKTAFALAHARVLTPDRVMQISVPPESVFVAGEARFLDEAMTFLSDVADALGQNPPGVSYETEIVVAGPWITARELAQGETLEISRAGAFASALAEREAPAGTVAVGVDHHETGEIRLTFYVRPEDTPRVDFSELVP